MGGQLIKGYSIQGEAIGAAGLMKTWKLFKGHKSGAQASASIFLIQKKQIKKQDRDQVIRVAKKQSSSLLRVRHPGVLAVIQPLTQDQNIVAFVTERIQGNLSQLIKLNKLQDFITSQLQLKLYLYSFIETVCFIHDNLKQVHLALSFDNIYVTAEGKWKIAGFGYNQTISGEQLNSIQQKITDLTFSAPEVAIQKQFNKKSDIFSIGLIILNLLEIVYKTYKPTSITDKNQYEKTMASIKNLSALSVVSKSKNPSELEYFLKNVLSWDFHQRFSLNQILQSSWINDSTLITVKYLDKINNYENKQQLQFLKGLAGVLDDFEVRVIIKIIIPKLLDLLKFNHLIASIIYITIDLLKKNILSQEQFRRMVWPSLKAVTQGKQITAQAIYLIVFNLEILQKFVGEPDSSTHILPLYLKCYECPQKLKHLALSMLQKLSKKIDYQFLKNKILPKLTILFKDQNMDIRKDALRALYSIIHLIDAQTLSLVILPGLEAARKMGSDSMINAIINKMYNMMTQSLSIEVISSKILPILIPYLAQPSINKTQFTQFKLTIIKMIEKIEKQREKVFQNNPLSHQNITIDETDFKFKQNELKAPEQKKGNYNFLSNYREFVQTNNIQQTAINNNQTTAESSLPTHPTYQTPTSQFQQRQIYQQNQQSWSNPNQFFSSYTPPAPATFNSYQSKNAQQIKQRPVFEVNNNYALNTNPYENMNFNFPSEPKTNETFSFPINNKTQSQFSMPQTGLYNSKNQSQREVKKFVGPTSSPKKQANNDVSLDLNYFQYNNNNFAPPTTSNNNMFSINLNPGGFNQNQTYVEHPKPIKPIAKPNFAGMNKKEPNLQFNIGNNLGNNLGNNMGNNLGNSLVNSLGNTFSNTLSFDDPFAEVDQDYGIRSNPVPQINLNMNKGISSPQKPTNTNSYFNSQIEEGKPKYPPIQKNNFQLI